MSNLKTEVIATLGYTGLSRDDLALFSFISQWPGCAAVCAVSILQVLVKSGEACYCCAQLLLLRTFFGRSPVAPPQKDRVTRHRLVVMDEPLASGGLQKPQYGSSSSLFPMFGVEPSASPRRMRTYESMGGGSRSGRNSQDHSPSCPSSPLQDALKRLEVVQHSYSMSRYSLNLSASGEVACQQDVDQRQQRQPELYSFPTAHTADSGMSRGSSAALIAPTATAGSLRYSSPPAQPAYVPLGQQSLCPPPPSASSSIMTGTNPWETDSAQSSMTNFPTTSIFPHTPRASIVDEQCALPELLLLEKGGAAAAQVDYAMQDNPLFESDSPAAAMGVGPKPSPALLNQPQLAFQPPALFQRNLQHSFQHSDCGSSLASSAPPSPGPFERPASNVVAEWEVAALLLPAALPRVQESDHSGTTTTCSPSPPSALKAGEADSSEAWGSGPWGGTQALADAAGGSDAEWGSGKYAVGASRDFTVVEGAPGQGAGDWVASVGHACMLVMAGKV